MYIMSAYTVLPTNEPILDRKVYVKKINMSILKIKSFEILRKICIQVICELIHMINMQNVTSCLYLYFPMLTLLAPINVCTFEFVCEFCICLISEHSCI